MAKKKSKKEEGDIRIIRSLEVQRIEDGYFKRERRENRAESGKEVESVEITYGDIERMYHKNNRDATELEHHGRERYKDNVYDGGDDEERELGREWYVRNEDKHRSIVVII